MDTNRTVSDSKRSFYEYHQRPINSIYRRVVEELLVEMHLLSVNVDFRPDPIYYVGVCESFDKFMEGYDPEADKTSIFNALCQAVEAKPEDYRQASQELLDFASKTSGEDLLAWLVNPEAKDGASSVAQQWKESLEGSKFKYSRLFAIGLYSVLEKSDSELVKEEDKLIESIKALTEKLSLPVDKLKKDLDLYRSNLNKMEQMLKMLADVLEASKKKQQKQAEEALAKAEKKKAESEEEKKPETEAPETEAKEAETSKEDSSSES